MEGDKDGGFLAITDEEMDVSNPTNQERDDKNTANHSMELRRWGLAIIGIFACTVFLPRVLQRDVVYLG
jgi:hypothetical protein